MLVFIFAVGCLGQEFICGTGSDLGIEPSLSFYRSEPLLRSDEISPLRLALDFIDGSDLSGLGKAQIREAFEAVKDFYFSALSLFPLTQNLKPESRLCGSIEYPKEAESKGYDADVVVFIHALAKANYTAIAQVCEQDGGDLKRPLIGVITIDLKNFMSIPRPRMIQFLIHEVAHILAFNPSLFSDFVLPNKNPYLPFEYNQNIERRGKSVKTIGFPITMEKAKRYFSCQTEGLELEDLEDKKFASHWESRIMPQDLMSSIILSDAVFSDITLGLFEDSGFYIPDYSMAGPMTWGKNQGPDWFTKSCINKKSTLQGFCNDLSDTPSCNFFSNSYGKCYIKDYKKIPDYENYFGTFQGGIENMDYCPVVIPSEDGFCQDHNGKIRIEYGENKGLKSMCFMSSVFFDEKKEKSEKFNPVCYNIQSCGDESLWITIGDKPYECRYNEILEIKDVGSVKCPKDEGFCFNSPCPNMCFGRGKCFKGNCECQDGYGGVDCGIKCVGMCRNCQEKAAQCLKCYDGFFINNQSCMKCSDNCKDCQDSKKCLKCNDGYNLIKSGTCEPICSKGCKNCNGNSCSQCEFGYALINQECQMCQVPCESCAQSTTTCTSCIKNYYLSNTLCLADCIYKCKDCEIPCQSCEKGYYLTKGICEKCAGPCKTCFEKADSCSLCNEGYELKGSKCEKKCTKNCKTCNDKCQECNEGFILNFDTCEYCLKYLESSDITAEYIRNYNAILISFSKPVLEMTGSCSALFEEKTISELSKPGSCIWESRNKLIVNIDEGMNYYIKTLYLKPIITFGYDCLDYPKDLIVDIKENIVKPEALISAPTFYSLDCDNGPLIIQGITEERKWEFRIDFEAYEDEEGSKSIDTAKAEEIKKLAKENKSKTLVIPYEFIDPCIINVTFITFNAMREMSEWVKTIKVVKEKGLSVSIDVGNLVSINSGQELKARAIFHESSCLNPSDLEFQWEYIQTSQIPFPQSQKILSESRLPYELIIRPGSLPPNRIHIFRVTAKGKHLSSFSDLIITVKPSNFVLKLDRSDGSISIKNNLKISVKECYDPDGLTTGINYIWTCHGGNSICLDIDGSILLKKTNDDNIFIGNGRMVKDIPYLFTLTATDGDRSTSRTVSITAVDSEGEIKTPDFPLLIDVDKDLFIYPEYFYDKEVSSFRWKQILGNDITENIQMDEEYLMIPKGIMQKDQNYKFRIEMKNAGEISFADVYWTTNQGPTCKDPSSVLYKNHVIIDMDCVHYSLESAQISYIYGLYVNNVKNPILVSKSSSVMIKLTQIYNEFYIEACDTFGTCVTKFTKISIPKGNIKRSFDEYNKEKMFPDMIPLAIWNHASSFNNEDVALVFKDLVKYILAQDIDLVHLKIAMGCLEVLGGSSKEQFFLENQEKILGFLTDVADRLEYIDEDSMLFLVEILSQNKLERYKIVSDAVNAFSSKWMTNVAPMTKRLIDSKFSIMRHRLIGNTADNSYEFQTLTISNLNIHCALDEICDLLISVYPDEPSSIIDLRLFKVGTYEKNTIHFIKQAEVHSDFVVPVIVKYNIYSTAHFECKQFRDSNWFDEGCKIVNQTSEFKLAIWQMSIYKLLYFGEKSLLNWALLTELAMIIACLAGTSAFYFLDHGKKPSIFAPTYHELECLKSKAKSIKSEESKLDEIEIMKIVGSEKIPEPSHQEKNLIASDDKSSKLDQSNDSKLEIPQESQNHPKESPQDAQFTLTDDMQTIEILEYSFPDLMYHPTRNLKIPQPGLRRMASFLHLFAILFSHMMTIGLAINPEISKVFDPEYNFLGMNGLQVLIMFAGVFLTQFMSFGIMLLNKVNDNSITKKISSMGISAFAISLSSGVSAYLSSNYPAVYNNYWASSFIGFSLIEYWIFQKAMWKLNMLFFKPSLNLFSHAG